MEYMSLVQEYLDQSKVLGIVETHFYKHEITQEEYRLLMIILKEYTEQSVITKHIQYNNQLIKIQFIPENILMEWLFVGTDTNILENLLEGKIVFDSNVYIYELKNSLKDFPLAYRELKMGIQFAKLLTSFYNGKAYFEKGHFIDAYCHMIHCLHHLARLTIIENGRFPELTVWSQVKQIDPEIFKLYQELVNSEESIEKRLDLLFIASEFLVHSRTKVGAKHLLNLLRQGEHWTIEELKSHSELKYYGDDLDSLIAYLVKKNVLLVKEVGTNIDGVMERYYYLN